MFVKSVGLVTLKCLVRIDIEKNFSSFLWFVLISNANILGKEIILLNPIPKNC